MQHVEHLETHAEQLIGGKLLGARLTGRFYTPEFVAEQLAVALTAKMRCRNPQKVAIVDPFCGDGRLIVAFLRRASALRKFCRTQFYISAWDTDRDAVSRAKAALLNLASERNLRVRLDTRVQDSFLNSTESFGLYDIVLTNPPWEALKPDRRELVRIGADQKRAFESSLRDYDGKLAVLLPNSQPDLKYSGWGTNLSRCGAELSILLLKATGLCGIVVPSSIFSDQVSSRLRRWLLREASPELIFYYPAEARLFEQVDQPCAAAVVRRVPNVPFAPVINRFDSARRLSTQQQLAISDEDLSRLSYSIPLELNNDEIRVLLRLHRFPTLDQYAASEADGLWMGRELDETGYKSFVSSSGKIPFVKGRNVSRYSKANGFTEFLSGGARGIPKSAFHERIAWRDVSRRSQTRRMIATILPGGCVTGNSLQVAYFKDDHPDKLYALLGILNSLPFEFQLRAKLGTGHVSLGTIRRVCVPQLENSGLVRRLAKLVREVFAGKGGAEAQIELAVARAFGLEIDEYSMILAHFDRLSEGFRKLLRGDYLPGSVSPRLKNHASKNTPPQLRDAPKGLSAKVPNHYTANLSKLDLDIARAVTPGGNWKQIPHSIPSKRLEQIRESFAAGAGSRSTYYGRLHPDNPSYTINTYFNRPGNGCHLHYDYEGGQHRVLSEREAARLQSFPDSFIFFGSHASVHKQIGNAVPPLLAYQIAMTLPRVGQYVDLFCGAGGLSLGFRWAGWQPIVANDIEASFLETYRHNIHPAAICGDIREKHIFKKIVETVKEQRREDVPLLVLGGPPCQGFSTAGHRRSLDDRRNHLFQEFKALVENLQPDGFVFENVAGLLNMDGGVVFEMIRDELRVLDNPLVPWILAAERFGVPQRRTRLFLMSLPKRWSDVTPPREITAMGKQAGLFGRISTAVSVKEALSDLPSLSPGEDGSIKTYRTRPGSAYQLLMRGVNSPAEFLLSMKDHVRVTQ